MSPLVARMNRKGMVSEVGATFCGRLGEDDDDDAVEDGFGVVPVAVVVAVAIDEVAVGVVDVN